MSQVIVPTIGRRVWYYPDSEEIIDTEPMICLKESQPFDAGVVFVHNDTLVNLVVTDHSGYVHRRTSVTLVQPGQEPPAGAYCTWMPYQIGKG